MACHEISPIVLNDTLSTPRQWILAQVVRCNVHIRSRPDEKRSFLRNMNRRLSFYRGARCGSAAFFFSILTFSVLDAPSVISLHFLVVLIVLSLVYPHNFIYFRAYAFRLKAPPDKGVFLLGVFAWVFLRISPIGGLKLKNLPSHAKFA